MSRHRHLLYHLRILEIIVIETVPIIWRLFTLWYSLRCLILSIANGIVLEFVQGVFWQGIEVIVGEEVLSIAWRSHASSKDMSTLATEGNPKAVGAGHVYHKAESVMIRGTILPIGAAFSAG
jgi:hypothetical protein